MNHLYILLNLWNIFFKSDIEIRKLFSSKFRYEFVQHFELWVIFIHMTLKSSAWHKFDLESDIFIVSPTFIWLLIKSIYICLNFREKSFSVNYRNEPRKIFLWKRVRWKWRFCMFKIRNLKMKKDCSTLIIINYLITFLIFFHPEKNDY